MKSMDAKKGEFFVTFVFFFLLKKFTFFENIVKTYNVDFKLEIRSYHLVGDPRVSGGRYSWIWNRLSHYLQKIIGREAAVGVSVRHVLDVKHQIFLKVCDTFT